MQIDLRNGVLPISKAVGTLPEQIRRAQKTNAPIVITQRGSPAALLLSVAAYEELCRRANGRRNGQGGEG